jgi:hypothetical protein
VSRSRGWVTPNADGGVVIVVCCIVDLLSRSGDGRRIGRRGAERAGPAAVPTRSL